MKILKKVSKLRVKRTFVVAEYIARRKSLGNNRVFLKNISESLFNKKLESAKSEVLKLKEKTLDSHISPKWPKRINSYNASVWFLAEMNVKEIGVWNRAGHLPLRWTNGSLYETAQKVTRGFKSKSKSIKGRPRYTIPNILSYKSHLEQKEKYLYPIVFKTNTGTQGRKRLKRKMKGDIEDGCMRSIALAMSGRDRIIVYFGIPKNAA